MMYDQENPRQLALFPELAEHSGIPSIATLPEFDRALGNLIKMSDMGAFIQLKIQGLEKVYSLNLGELNIPDDFLIPATSPTTFVVHLFPLELRNQIKKFTYEIKAFFNVHNSFRTPFGYFLFRSPFVAWKEFLDERRNTIQQFLTTQLGKGAYGRYFLEHFLQGYHYLQGLADYTAPWEFHRRVLLKDIQECRKELQENRQSLHTLKPTEVDFPFQVMVLKTAHVPMVLHQFLSQIQIHSFFKTIHLEYLAKVEINSLDDIRNLAEQL